MRTSSIVTLAATILMGATAVSAQAEGSSIFGNPHDWMIRLRAIDVHPDPDSTVTGLVADITADNAIVPELDITYFWTDNIATELILATSNHDMGTNTGVDLGDTWILPPQLTLQYHFLPESEAFRPYIGAGLGYMIYYGEDAGAVTSVKYEDGISYTLQAGADFPIDNHWAFNVDVKKVYHNVDVKVNGGAITADVDLDPWVFGVGVGYRF
ncbi:MAG: hypothetical protein COV36_01485 [Alphaproteobacteria bacterium CG11_big_fil_rev_8_21_14_0_20_44_7]|nr:MAG: hypothetical protein COV36_01485 [Alphaproteobacteria bacterium CG11_big_fil_rev_8_21_14_0_20_44_7]